MSGKVCYNNLFKLLIDKGLKKSELARMCNLSSPTMAKLSKNEYVPWMFWCAYARNWIVHSMILLK